jgi:hypothetical protein
VIELTFPAEAVNVTGSLLTEIVWLPELEREKARSGTF